MEPVLAGAIAFYVAWNLGANDVANAMGTSVGSGALRLRQALLVAGILEFAGVLLFGERVAATLAGNIIRPADFVATPGLFVAGMMAALLSCGLWLQGATLLGLPVSSSHAIVGAIAGFGGVAAGSQAVNWRSLGMISLAWLVTPLISGAIAALFFMLINRWILQQSDPNRQLQEWLPWLSAALVGIFGGLVLPVLVRRLPLQGLGLPPQTLMLGLGAIATGGFTLWGWNAQEQVNPGQQIAAHPPAAPTALFARFQVLSACGVAFAHGSNDVGNAIAPLAAILQWSNPEAIAFSLDRIAIPFWVLALGGVGIVGGLAVAGGAVIQTIGQGILPLVPSLGFCAELATATTVLLATRLGLPVSTSHALVGAVVGIGLAQNQQNNANQPLQTGTLRQIALAWFLTLPVCAALSAFLLSGWRWLGLG